MHASTLYNIKPTYLSNLAYTESSLRVRSSHELAPMHYIPENLSGSEKLSLVKKFNKKTKTSPPIITALASRPDVSDMEIALIVSSFNSIPLTTIAHTLNLDEDRVINIYNQYKHEAILQLPLVTLLDTSRNLTEENERTIYDADDLNNIADPLTDKELLRISLPRHTTDTKLLTNYISERHERGHSTKSYGTLVGHLFTPETTEELHPTLYGRTWSEDFTSVFSKGVLNNHLTISHSFPYYHSYYVKTRDRFKNNVYLKHEPYYLTHNLTQHTHLLDTYLNLYNTYLHNTKHEPLEDSFFMESNVYSLNNLLNSDPNKIPILFHGTKYHHRTYSPHTLSQLIDKPIDHTVTYTTDLSLIGNYKPLKTSSTSTTLYIPLNIVRPPIHTRSLGSPLQDTNKNLRYRFPPNTFTRFKPSSKSRPIHTDLPIPAIICSTCSTFLSPHTVTTCECKAITIHTVLNYTSTPKNHSKGNIKNIKINITSLEPNLRTKVLSCISNSKDPSTEILVSKTKYMYGTNKKLFYMSKNRPPAQYSYTHSTKYQHEFSSPNKYHIEVYHDITNPKFTYHAYNYSSRLSQQQPSTKGIFNVTPNILPLHTTFQFVLSSTLKEPHAL